MLYPLSYGGDGAEFYRLVRTMSTERLPVTCLGPSTPFPPLEQALAEPNGLLAYGGDLSPLRLVDAYRHGIFPWYSDGQPLLWWSPDPRMVLEIDAFRVSRSLSRRIRRREFEIRVDTAFAAVIEACASRYPQSAGSTWITRAMSNAYRSLHALGYVHSVEAWRGDELAGGLYGLALGKVFFGESMFTRVTDASKVALAGLVEVLRGHHVPLIDCQQQTRHLASLGARPIARKDFARHLAELIHSTAVPGGWKRGPIAEFG